MQRLKLVGQNAKVTKLKPEYKEWIDINVKVPQNNCESYSIMMHDKFPELKLVRGFYNEPVNVKTPHWWLKDKDGNIVDPTFDQFIGPQLKFFYEEWKVLGDWFTKPVGICIICGEESFDTDSCCDNKQCKTSYTELIKELHKIYK